MEAPKPTWDDRAGPILTIWDQWQLSGSPHAMPVVASNLRSMINNSALARGVFWPSTVLTINDPTLNLIDKVIQWNFLNVDNHSVIACAALKNDNELAKTVNVGIFLKLVEDRTGCKYDHRSFIIEKVALLPREDTDEFANQARWTKGNARDPQNAIRTTVEHSKLLVGFCRLPGGHISETQMWMVPAGPLLTQVSLPPGFDLHRYITHVNRGITHFHASFWPLPRKISDADLDSAPIPEGWVAYAQRHHTVLSGLKGQCVIGVENPDGSRVPIYKFGLNGHFRRCAPGETDTDGPEEFKKLLVDPSRMVRMIAGYLQIFDAHQDATMKEKKYPGYTAEQIKAALIPNH
ncbi:hypothetical protein DFH09DRAFT_1354919 [Mycena vulgaris]|nr:hypothetical protein DFH09DRAFT_1354919 [Mycena vulgaris]